MKLSSTLHAAKWLSIALAMMPFFMNCTGFSPNVKNGVTILPSDSPSMSLSVTEEMGSRTLPVKDSDAIVVGQSYSISVQKISTQALESSEGILADLSLTWTLTTLPEGACTLLSADPASFSRELKCAVSAAVRVEIQDASDPTRKIVITKNAIVPSQLQGSGKTLYESKCMACHGPLASSSIADKTPAQIALALVHVPSMSHLKELTPTEIHSLTRVLDSSPDADPTPMPSPTPGLPNLDGAKLYATHCSKCHGALDSSQKLSRTSLQIKTAIASVASMKSLSFLKPEEVDAIAEALKPAAVVEKVPVKRKGRMVGRYYISDLFREVFHSPSFAIDTAIRPILYKPNIFGTACDVNSSFAGQDCGAVISGTSADLLMESTTVRQLTKLKACEDILHSSAAVLTAAGLTSGLASATSPKEVTDALLPEMFSLFHRSRPMKAEELKAYSTMVKALKTKTPTMTPMDQWRAVLLAMCESPEWEAL